MQKAKVDGNVRQDTYVFISPEDLRKIADQMHKMSVEAHKTGQTAVTYRMTDTIILYYEPKALFPPLESVTSSDTKVQQAL